MKDLNSVFRTAACPITRTMGVLGGKWKPIIIFNLAHKRVRFGQLAQKLSLISRKVLTEQLKELEDDGIIRREAFAELPPRVEYHLTPHGLELLPILEQLCKWHSAGSVVVPASKSQHSLDSGNGNAAGLALENPN